MKRTDTPGASNNFQLSCSHIMSIEENIENKLFMISLFFFPSPFSLYFWREKWSFCSLPFLLSHFFLFCSTKFRPNWGKIDLYIYIFTFTLFFYFLSIQKKLHVQSSDVIEVASCLYLNVTFLFLRER